MNKKKYILAYGILRDGMWLYDFYHDVGHMKYVETKDIYGFTMYDLGNFPVIRPSLSLHSENDKIVCDILECSEETFDDIFEQQMKNGFYMLKVVTVMKTLDKSDECFIFPWKNPVSDQYIVRGGDWWKHILKKNNKLIIENVKKENYTQEQLELSFSRSNN